MKRFQPKMKWFLAQPEPERALDTPDNLGLRLRAAFPLLDDQTTPGGTHALR
jgi:hypothetical protein